jgi:ATP10 protein
MKYLKFILPVVCYLFVNTISAQVGNDFPTVVGESLTNEVIDIPKDTKGKYSIIGMAWSKKGEEELEDWFVPVFDLFIDKESFIPTVYDVNVYFLPMFSGFKKGAHKKVMADAKKYLDEKLQPHVLFYKGKVREYRKELNFEDRTIVYFFVLDKTGKIVHAVSGKYKEEKLDGIEKFIAE